jgi:hypothetical protein
MHPSGRHHLADVGRSGRITRHFHEKAARVKSRQLVSSIATGAAISEPNWMISTSEDLRSWRVPQSPELDDFQ